MYYISLLMFIMIFLVLELNHDDIAGNILGQIVTVPTHNSDPSDL